MSFSLLLFLWHFIPLTEVFSPYCHNSLFGKYWYTNTCCRYFRKQALSVFRETMNFETGFKGGSLGFFSPLGQPSVCDVTKALFWGCLKRFCPVFLASAEYWQHSLPAFVFSACVNLHGTKEIIAEMHESHLIYFHKLQPENEWLI